jgi:MFS family permease
MSSSSSSSQLLSSTNGTVEMTTIITSTTTPKLHSVEVEEPAEEHGRLRPEDSDDTTTAVGSSNAAAAGYYYSFVRFSFLFAAVPAAAICCLALAEARLGSTGARQTGWLYGSYCTTAVSGVARVLVQGWGSHAAMVVGQSLLVTYVACFGVVALQVPGAAVVGAILGGVGSAVLWTAQGVYLAQASEAYAWQSGIEWSASTSTLSGVFACILLVEETVLDLLSTILVRTWNVPWSVVFSIYAVIAILATLGMYTLVQPFPREEPDGNSSSSHYCTVAWENLSSTLSLLITDSKLKYMTGFVAAFAFAGAFLNAFVSREVVPASLHDDRSSLVGLFVAVHGGSAALCSYLFGHLSQRIGKGPVLIIGATAFAGVAFPFLLRPSVNEWTYGMLLTVYALEGVGRATYEGTLRAIFADFFPYQKEAAFSNIILVDGLSSVIAYILSVRLSCKSLASPYCIQYRDGTFHNVGVFASLVVGIGFVAIVGYWRASCLSTSGVGQRRLTEYRHRSIAMYRNSLVSLVPKMDRRTYGTLIGRAMGVQAEQQGVIVEELPKLV